MKELKKLDKKGFGVAGEPSTMCLKLAEHIAVLEEVIEEQGQRIAVLEDEAGVDAEFEELKREADELGVKYPGNIKKDTLKEKIEEAKGEENGQGEASN